jgi:hypothetical protein
MLSFFINTEDQDRFCDYLRDSLNCPSIRLIGKRVAYFPNGHIDERWYLVHKTWYQQVSVDINLTDFTAVKFMFDIKTSLFHG